MANTIITPQEFPWQWFEKIPYQHRKRGNLGTKTRVAYKNIITAFDIETTRIKTGYDPVAKKPIEHAIMYVWQWQFGEKYTVIGRTWEEFLEFADKLVAHLKEMTLCVYVHNLSYEFQFLKGIYKFTSDEVFAIKSRKVLKCVMKNFIEFRCSYLHSNMSLYEYTSKMGAEHSKITGVFDYSKTRYPWTDLSKDELDYCIHDVLGLVEALAIEMDFDGDNLYTIPLTSTGYVRRDAKRAMRKQPRGYVAQQLPNFQIYEMLHEAFRGGNTHANRYFAGKTLHNVKSADRSSSYPDTQCNCMFPISKFTFVGQQSFDEVCDLINRRKKAVLMRVAFTNIRLIDETWGCPYLAVAKCKRTEKCAEDNGRILSAEYIETTVTDIDFKIILSEYEFDDCVCYDVAHARYGRLPQSLIDETIKYYKAKTELKNVDGEELYYMKSKNKLNSIYGMMAQNPVRVEVGFMHQEFYTVDTKAELALLEYNEHAFLNYAWGVWTTAWSRLRLEEGIRLAHGENAWFVYCDTDSVKYLGEIDWESYNQERIEDSTWSKAYATDPKGETHYMGVYEMEHEMLEFKTLGAKKYCYRIATKDGGTKLITTIAGVSKALGGSELEEHGGIEAFKEGFIFRKAGGTEIVYNDKTDFTLNIDNHIIRITDNAVIRDSTYQLGVTAEYERLLKRCNRMI